MPDGIFAQFDGHEQVAFTHDAESGLECIIAIHSTQLGPALGGTRFRPYVSEQEALTDVLRLSQAMTYKSACAGIHHGGGKAVIIGDPGTVRSEALLRAYGQAIESLNGRYIAACDVGTTPSDMAMVRQETRWVTGMDPAEGGSGDSGILTAYGVYLAMQVTAQAAFGSASLAGRHIAVQGLGKVGSRLVGHLAEAGAKITVSDVSGESLEQVAGINRVDSVAVDQILEVDADILSPNALGAVLNERTIPRLQVRAICGGANNQLAKPEDADRLDERGILYAPDYAVNAGGVINVAEELHPSGYSAARARQRAEAIPQTLRHIIEVSRSEGITTEAAATRVAQRRIADVPGRRQLWLRQ